MNKKTFKIHGKILSDKEVINRLNEQEETINELKQRNQRQYNRLKEITDLMYKRDWKRLETMVNDWEQWEKQLEQEWGTYCGDKRMTDNTERYMIDDAGTLIDKKTCKTYDYIEEILPTLNQQENKIKELQEELQNLQTFKKILDYAEKDMEERADWQAYCEKEFEGL